MIKEMAKVFTHFLKAYWKDNKIHGYNRNKYEGAWEDYKMHGKGVFNSYKLILFLKKKHHKIENLI